LQIGKKAYVFGFTSHLLHRLAERNSLDISRTEAIFELLKVYLNKVSISVDGENVLMFSDNGVFLGNGSAIITDKDADLDKRYKLAQMNQGDVSIVYFNTFITQDMMQKVEEEPKEATDIFSQIESMYQDAVFECGRLAASNNGFNSTPPNGAAS
jgi:hypothetical protein